MAKGMGRVFTTVKGDVRRIGNYGEASNDEPAVVPDDVAAELDGQDGFKVERDHPAKKTTAKGKG